MMSQGVNDEREGEACLKGESGVVVMLDDDGGGGSSGDSWPQFTRKERGIWPQRVVIPGPMAGEEEEEEEEVARRSWGLTSESVWHVGPGGGG